MILKLNKSDYQFGLIYLLVGGGWLFFKFYSEGVPLLEIVIDIVVFWIKIISSFFLFKFLLDRFILQRKYYLLFFISLIFGFILIGTFAYLMGLYSAGSLTQASLTPFSNLVINGFYTVATDITLFLGIILGKKYYDKQLEIAGLQLENQKNRLSILRTHFDPHFLFNNLNTIDALIDTKPNIAKKYIKHLASIYRYNITSQEEDLVLFSDELAFAKSYLFLIEIRFDKEYVFDLEMSSEIQGLYLPSGALQTTIENVIKHNVAANQMPVKTRIYLEDDWVVIVNNKPANKSSMRKVESPQTGLKNLSKRYKLLTNRDIEILNSDHEFKIRLPLVLLKQ